MMEYTAVGEPRTVKRYLDDFAVEAGADELIVTLMSPGVEQRLRAATLLAEVCDLAPA